MLFKESKVPLMTAMDAEWGVAMRLDSVMPFPWPMTLGAVKDSTLLRKIGKRMECKKKAWDSFQFWSYFRY